MQIDFPDHQPGAWESTPFWRLVLGWDFVRRTNWRWTVDHNGCEATSYWEYGQPQTRAGQLAVRLGKPFLTGLWCGAVIFIFEHW